ncbi:MAG: GNAT family N-acetyltransferase [Desulfobulbaceae bacterium]|nr:GNAT family N-acetyltransferase [Desulfobulbaceae bacterium]
MSSLRTLASRIKKPLLEIGGVRLRAVWDTDLPFLFELSTSFETLHLWDDGHIDTVEKRFAEVFQQKANTRTFFIVESIIQNESSFKPIGLAYFYSLDSINEWAYYTIALHPKYVGSGAGYIASVLAMEWVFYSWSLNKLYVEILSDNSLAVNTAIRLGFEKEAHFTQHRRIAGDHFDVVVLALSRKRWVSEFRSGAIERAKKQKGRT